MRFVLQFFSFLASSCKLASYPHIALDLTFCVKINNRCRARLYTIQGFFYVLSTNMIDYLFILFLVYVLYFHIASLSVLNFWICQLQGNNSIVAHFSHRLLPLYLNLTISYLKATVHKKTQMDTHWLDSDQYDRYTRYSDMIF